MRDPSAFAPPGRWAEHSGGHPRAVRPNPLQAVLLRWGESCGSMGGWRSTTGSSARTSAATRGRGCLTDTVGGRGRAVTTRASTSTASGTSRGCGRSSRRRGPATCSCSPTGGATPTRGWARTGSPWPNCSPVPPGAASSSRACSGARTSTRSRTPRRRTGRWPTTSARPAARCCSTCACCRWDRTTRSSSSCGIPIVRRRTSPSSAASTCATPAATTARTSATRRR